MLLRVQINNKLERKFREAAMKRFGYAKGALSKAAEEAILNWISNLEKETLTFKGAPIGGYRRAPQRCRRRLGYSST